MSLPPWGRALQQQLHGDFMIPQSRGSHLMEVFYAITALEPSDPGQQPLTRLAHNVLALSHGDGAADRNKNVHTHIFVKINIST